MRQFRLTCLNIILAVAAGAMLLASGSAWSQSDAARRKVAEFNIPAGDLAAALKTFGEQSDTDVLFDPKVTASKHTGGLMGKHGVQEGLTLLLEEAGLKFRVMDGKTVLVEEAKGGAVRISQSEGAGSEMQKVEAAPAGSASSSSGSDVSAEASDENTQGIPEILVKGRRTINADIRRTENDPQPYVVFTADEIERSQATNLDDFFRTRLSMNTVSESSSSNAGNPLSGQSSINLRGLGVNQTLILVDGRRVPGVNLQGASAASPSLT